MFSVLAAGRPSHPPAGHGGHGGVGCRAVPADRAAAASPTHCRLLFSFFRRPHVPVGRGRVAARLSAYFSTPPDAARRRPMPPCGVGGATAALVSLYQISRCCLLFLATGCVPGRDASPAPGTAVPPAVGASVSAQWKTVTVEQACGNGNRSSDGRRDTPQPRHSVNAIYLGSRAQQPPTDMKRKHKTASARTTRDTKQTTYMVSWPSIQRGFRQGAKTKPPSHAHPQTTRLARGEGSAS